MPHTIIAGITGSGKSRLAKQILIPGWRRRGYAVLVLDPIGQPWPGATWQTDDSMAFLAKAQASEKCVLIVDECSTALRGDAKIERATRWLATQSRNRGHIAYFLGQRVLQMQPDIRDNCGAAFVFRQNPDCAAWFADQWDVREVATEAPRLPMGVCLQTEPFKTPVKMRVFHEGH